MNQPEQSSTPEELKNLEDDAVWALLDKVRPTKNNPAFVSNLMPLIAEVEQSKSNIATRADKKVVASPSFWKRYSIPLGGAAFAGAAACVLLALNIHKNTPSKGAIAITPDPEIMTLTEDEIFTNLAEEDQLDQLIATENEDPFIMTADDIHVLVSM